MVTIHHHRAAGTQGTLAEILRASDRVAQLVAVADNPDRVATIFSTGKSQHGLLVQVAQVIPHPALVKLLSAGATHYLALASDSVRLTAFYDKEDGFTILKTIAAMRDRIDTFSDNPDIIWAALHQYYYLLQTQPDSSETYGLHETGALLQECAIALFTEHRLITPSLDDYMASLGLNDRAFIVWINEGLDRAAALSSAKRWITELKAPGGAYERCELFEDKRYSQEIFAESGKAGAGIADIYALDPEIAGIILRSAKGKHYESYHEFLTLGSMNIATLMDEEIFIPSSIFGYNAIDGNSLLKLFCYSSTVRMDDGSSPILEAVRFMQPATIARLVTLTCLPTSESHYLRQMLEDIVLSLDDSDGRKQLRTTVLLLDDDIFDRFNFEDPELTAYRAVERAKAVGVPQTPDANIFIPQFNIGAVSQLNNKYFPWLIEQLAALAQATGTDEARELLVHLRLCQQLMLDGYRQYITKIAYHWGRMRQGLEIWWPVYAYSCRSKGQPNKAEALEPLLKAIRSTFSVADTLIGNDVIVNTLQTASGEPGLQIHRGSRVTGRIRIIGYGEDPVVLKSIKPFEIVVLWDYPRTGSDLPPPAGVLTSLVQSPNSHAMVLSRDHWPQTLIAEFPWAHELLRSFDGTWVTIEKDDWGSSLKIADCNDVRAAIAPHVDQSTLAIYPHHEIEDDEIVEMLGGEEGLDPTQVRLHYNTCYLLIRVPIQSYTNLLNGIIARRKLLSYWLRYYNLKIKLHLG